MWAGLERAGTARKVFLVFGASMLAALFLLLPARDAQAQGAVRMRDLAPEENAAAWEAWTPAYKKTEEYREKYQTPVETSAEEEADFRESVAGLEAIIGKYPGTDIAARAQQTLAGCYGHRGDTGKELELLKDSARRYSGTKYEGGAYQSIGLHYLQGEQDAEAALPWFEKVPLPGGAAEHSVGPEGRMSESHGVYIPSQELAAKCEIELGRVEDARKRCEALAARYPMYRSSIMDDYKFAVQHAKLQEEYIPPNRRAKNKPAEPLAAPSPSIPLNGKTEPIPAPFAPPLQRTAADGNVVLLDPGKGAQAPQAHGSDKESPADAQEHVPASSPVYEEDLFQGIELYSKDGTLSEEAKRLLDEMTQKNVSLVARLSRAYDRAAGSYGRRHFIIEALKRQGSEEAKSALLNLAMKEDGTSHSLTQEAAKAFVSLAKDSTEAAKALSSADSRARDTVIGEMQGSELTPEATEALGKLLASRSWITHNRIGGAFGTDKSPRTAGRKLDLIFQAIGRLDELENAEIPDPELRITGAECAVAQYVFAMSNMPGADEGLQKRLGTARGLERQLIVLSLARRGKSDVAGELRAIIRNTQDGHMRLMAVAALRPYASQEDIPLLQSLVASDPFMRIDHHRMRPPPPNKDYPVRLAAENVLRTLLAKPAQP